MVVRSSVSVCASEDKSAEGPTTLNTRIVVNWCVNCSSSCLVNDDNIESRRLNSELRGIHRDRDLSHSRPFEN